MVFLLAKFGFNFFPGRGLLEFVQFYEFFWRRRSAGEANWEYAIKQDFPSLETFCQKKGLTSTAKDPAVYTAAPFPTKILCFVLRLLEQSKSFLRTV